MKRWRLAIAGIVLLAYLWPTAVFATSYDVNASVPYPAPTQAAQIDTALNNLTVQNAAFTISGTCQTLTPVGVISVWRGSTILGSQSCNSGTFSLLIVLSEGNNSLVVKTANASNIYGPDSASITVTLNTPVTPTPEPPATTPAPAPQATTAPGATNLTVGQNNDFNTGAQTGLSIVPQLPFSVLPDNNQVSLQFVIDGGSTPYTIELNWGDGTVERKVIEQPGTYVFTHQYKNNGDYVVKGRVTDVLGAITEISHAVVSTKVPIQRPSVVVAQVKPSNSLLDWLTRNWIATVLGVSAVVVAGIAFWLGEYTGAHVAVTQTAAQQTKPKASKSTKKAKPARRKPTPRSKK